MCLTVICTCKQKCETVTSPIFYLWANAGLFLFIFSLFNQTFYNFTTNVCEKCPSGIRRQDMNSQPSD